MQKKGCNSKIKPNTETDIICEYYHIPLRSSLGLEREKKNQTQTRVVERLKADNRV